MIHGTPKWLFKTCSSQHGPPCPPKTIHVARTHSQCLTSVRKSNRGTRWFGAVLAMSFPKGTWQRAGYELLLVSLWEAIAFPGLRRKSEHGLPVNCFGEARPTLPPVCFGVWEDFWYSSAIHLHLQEKQLLAIQTPQNGSENDSNTNNDEGLAPAAAFESSSPLSIKQEHKQEEAQVQNPTAKTQGHFPPLFLVGHCGGR
jgi:hypothetical protein